MAFFKLLFPMRWLEDVLLANINKNIAGPRVSLSEYFRWLGLWCCMATFKGHSRHEHWSSREVDDFRGAPVRFHRWMSKRRFDAILLAMEYTDLPAPSCRDRFHRVRQMIAAWNENMTECFLPSWVSCLDESMSPWTTRWTCPGWMFVPRKPHPIGNEYHSVCCGETGIMWGIELVEGKDAPPERPRDPTNEHGKTCGLLLRMCKPIYMRGMVVILYSGFCVLKGLIELSKKGVCASAVIKKRKYWPRHVPGFEMDERMRQEGVQVGDTNSLAGNLDGVDYDLLCVRDVEFVMKLMFTHGGLTVPSNAETKRRKIKRRDGTPETLLFKCQEPWHNHYLCRHAVDDHNNMRHSDISFEETWVTHRWEH